MGFKLCKFCETRAKDTPLRALRGVYIPHFDQISVKISVLGSYTLIVAPMGVKFDVEEGTSHPPRQISPHRSCNAPAPAGWKPRKSASE